MSVDEGVPVVFPRDVAGELHARMTAACRARCDERSRDLEALGYAPELDLERPLPSREIVARLVDVGYVASLLEEEGRMVRCGFGYLSEPGALARGYRVFRFGEPMPFSPSTLAKLSPAMDPGRTELAVFPEAGTLAVWGFIHRGDQSFGIDLQHLPTHFSLRGLGPGAFTVHFDERLLLLFSRDHAHFFDAGIDLAGVLESRAGVTAAVAGTLCRLARRMLSHGHGGTLLVVDRVAPPNGLVWHGALTPPSGSHAMLTSAVRLEERASTKDLEIEIAPPSAVQRLAIEVALGEALDFVARLTAVDGAVLIDHALGILGAGITIQTPESAMPREIVLEDPRGGVPERRATLSELGGNRHRSAVCFCSQQPGRALALVASQDGDLSIFARRDDGLVHVIRPFELGVGI